VFVAEINKKPCLRQASEKYVTNIVFNKTFCRYFDKGALFFSGLLMPYHNFLPIVKILNIVDFCLIKTN